MNLLQPFLPIDFGLSHALAIGLIFFLWGLYTPILGIIGRGSLNTQLHAVRLRWLHMHQSVPRDQRVIDALMLGHISSSVSYFGSATLIILAALIGTLVNINRVYIVTRELAFLAPMSPDLFALNFALVTLILLLCLFAFTYALRKMAYVFAMLGGLDVAAAATPEVSVMADQTARVLTEAVKSINNGIRGFYYAVAALFLFAGPVACVVATVLITGLLYYRQLYSPTAIAIAKYVAALKRVKE
jgi:uncharacterized membrane protein